MHLTRRVTKGAASLRIEHPDVSNAHLEVIRQSFIEPRDSVFRRKNLDAQERRSAHDRIARIGSQQHTNIRDPKTCWGDLYSLSGQDADTPLSSSVKEKSSQTDLRQAVWPLAQVALLNLAVHVIPIRTKARSEIFLNRNECGARHRRPHLLCRQSTGAE